MNNEMDNFSLTDEEIKAISTGKVLDGVYEKIDKFLEKVSGDLKGDKEYYIDFILHRLLYSDRTIYGKELIDDTNQVKQYISDAWDRIIKK